MRGRVKKVREGAIRGKEGCEERGEKRGRGEKRREQRNERESSPFFWVANIIIHNILNRDTSA